MPRLRLDIIVFRESPAKGVQGYRVPGFLLRRRPTMPPFIPSLANGHYHIIGRRRDELYFFLKIRLFPDVGGKLLRLIYPDMSDRFNKNMVVSFCYSGFFVRLARF